MLPTLLLLGLVISGDFRAEEVLVGAALAELWMEDLTAEGGAAAGVGVFLGGILGGKRSLFELCMFQRVAGCRECGRALVWGQLDTDFWSLRQISASELR